MSDVAITCTSIDCPERTGGVCNAAERMKDVHIDIDPEPFDDRWKCLMCRTAERICDFHQSMEADGYKPPLNFSSLL